MIYAYVALLVVIGLIGIFLDKKFQKQLAQITSELQSILTTRTGKQLIETFSTNIYDIKIIQDSKAYSSDYYNPSENTFYLSQETANSKNGAAAGISIYLTLLVRIAKQQVRKPSLLFIANSFPKLLVFLFAIIALFSGNIIFLFLSMICYGLVLLSEILLNGSQYLINKNSIRKLRTEQDFEFTEEEIKSASRYISFRQNQAFVMFFFNPIAVTAYYLYFLFGGK
jgi:Zn-dependent membrane protease YugP